MKYSEYSEMDREYCLETWLHAQDIVTQYRRRYADMLNEYAYRAGMGAQYASELLGAAIVDAYCDVYSQRSLDGLVAAMGSQWSQTGRELWMTERAKRRLYLSSEP